ncbi:MAG TPA: hypothetical protein VHO29_01960 [Marmoricola sp.]|nr:hypothetical protein [Marmoricola sp.]
MADQPTTPSGSRWEPDPDHAPAAETPETPDTPWAEATPVAPDGTTADERRAQLRRRAGLAGAATALALGAGVTGFVLGHSTADGGRDRLSPANFSNQLPGSGQLGEGQPGPPGFGDRDGDHGWDHDGGGGFSGPGQQPPRSGGSSGSSSSNGSSSSATAPSTSGT